MEENQIKRIEIMRSDKTKKIRKDKKERRDVDFNSKYIANRF